MDTTKSNTAIHAKKIQTLQTSKSKTLENIWKYVYIFVNAIMLVLVYKIYLFHTLEQFKDIKKGQLVNLLKYGLPISFIYIALDYGFHYCLDQWIDKNYLRLDKYKNQEIRKIKSKFVVRLVLNIVQHFPISIVGYFLIKETYVMPEFLGGNGSIYGLVNHRYLDGVTFGMQLYYYIQFGKHLGRYIYHAFINAQGNYYQFLLHHTLATFLIVFSFLMDMWILGIFVLIIHDFSDAILCVGKIYRQSRKIKKILVYILYILLMVSWLGMRLVIFGYCCVWAVWYQIIHDQDKLTEIQLHVFYLPYYFMAFMLSFLLLMHILWSYFLIKSFLIVAIKNNKKQSID